MSCSHCAFPDGGCAYPWYGLAPHEHAVTVQPRLLEVSTTLDERTTWPANFVEDADAPGCGTYVRCPFCGAPEGSP